MSKVDFNNIEVAIAFPVDGPVTVCRPGQRSKEIRERVKDFAGGPTLSTATKLNEGEPRVIVHGQSHERFDASSQAAQTEVATLETVVGQPHRRDAEDPRDPRLAFPLWRFCLKVWPNDAKFRSAMYRTGEQYAAELRAAKVARGHHVPGCESDGAAGGEESSADDMTPEGIANLRALIYGLERTVERSDEVLRSVMPRCPAAMVRLCWDHVDPSIYDGDMLKHGLYMLAMHYGHWERPGGR